MRSKGLHIALWIVQIVVALMFAIAGTMKTTKPIAELAKMMVWPGQIPEDLVRFIGAAELTGAVGLILPSATRIKPKLTVLAALGLVTVMVLAAAFHISRSENDKVPINVVLGGLSAFIAWGRWKKAPIAAR